MVKCPKCGKEHKAKEHLTDADMTAIIETLEIASEHAYDVSSWGYSKSEKAKKDELDHIIRDLEFEWFNNDADLKGYNPTQKRKEYIIEQMELAATHGYDPEDKDDIETRDKWLVPFIRKMRKKWNVTTPESYAW